MASASSSSELRGPLARFLNDHVFEVHSDLIVACAAKVRAPRYQPPRDADRQDRNSDTNIQIGEVHHA